MVLPNEHRYQIRAKEGPGGGGRNVVFSICVQYSIVLNLHSGGGLQLISAPPGKCQCRNVIT